MRIPTFVLFLTLLLHTFSRTVVIVDFYANQDNIARELCINRLRTAIHCGGTCQLDKRLRQDNKDNSDPERKSDNRNIVISSRSFYLTSFLLLQPVQVCNYPPAIAADPIDRPSAHFHPPGWPLFSLS